MKKILLFSLLSLVAVISRADILTLLNGHSFEGRVLKIKDCSVVFKCEGHKYYVVADSIFSVEFEDVHDPIYTDYLALASSDACLKGMADAQQFHGKGFTHVVLGFLFGPFAVVGAALASPNPYNGKRTVLMSPNRDTFSDPIYLKCYKKKAKGRNVGHAALGWGVWLFVYFSTT